MSGREENTKRCNSIYLRDKFISGDNDAYAELYKMYVNDLYSFGLSLRIKRFIIEDAIHDIFEEIYSNRNILINVDNLKFYFFAAFRNRLFYLLKKESGIIDGMDLSIQNLTDENHLDRWIEEETNDEKRELITRLIGRLNANQQQIIHLRFMEGLSLEEISLLMNINYQSVKNLIHRAVKKMNKLKTDTLSVILLLYFLDSVISLNMF